jgi:hypothetical protein
VNQKSEGANSLARIAPSSDFSKIRIGIQITTPLQFRFGKELQASRLRFLYPPSLPVLYELSRLHPMCLQFPERCEIPLPVPNGFTLIALSFREDLSSVGLNSSAVPLKRNRLRNIFAVEMAAAIVGNAELAPLFMQYSRDDRR